MSLADKEPQLIEVTVSGLGINGSSNSPVVILKEKEGTRVLPIWIGHNEASAIAMELAGVKFKRPLTHDLLKMMLVALDAELGKVVISELKDNTYYAHLYIRQGKNTMSIDARPSDSIALALRMQAPIFTVDGLLSDTPVEMSKQKEYDPEKLREQLKNMSPEDFGKFSI
jgi:bifunctional DNase/RNase